MSKKNKSVDSVSDLAQNALSDSAALSDDKTLDVSEILKQYDSEKSNWKPYCLPVSNRVFVNGKFRIDVPFEFSTTINFSPSVTEQIHSLSLAEQIKRGQGSAQDILDSDKRDYYDFPNGVDDGRKAVGLYELSEPAYAFEREQEFKRVVGMEISEQVLRRQSEKAMKNVVQAQEKSSKTNSNVPVDDKSLIVE